MSSFAPAAMTSGIARKEPNSGVIVRPADMFRGPLGGPGRWFRDPVARWAPPVEGAFRHPMRELSGTRVELSDAEVNGYYELTTVGDELLTVTRNLLYKGARSASMRGDGLIRFEFHLSGERSVGVTRDEQLRVHRPSLLVYHQPLDVEVLHWATSTSRECGVAITLRPQYLAQQFLSSIADPPSQLRALVRSDRFEPVQLPLDAKMFELAANLVNNPYPETALRLLHTEAVTLQLLCAAIQQFFKQPEIPRARYSERELRCLRAARRFLMKQLSPAPTIRQVARAAGINETSLKQGFKAVFGDTIYNFSVRCRMERAFRLLQEEYLSISKIASAVGYTHQTSFATAFRRQFGVSPRDVRPQRLR
jgi:AraC-like DNA-binding protein